MSTETPRYSKFMINQFSIKNNNAVGKMFYNALILKFDIDNNLKEKQIHQKETLISKPIPIAQHAKNRIFTIDFRIDSFFTYQPKQIDIYHFKSSFN